MIPHDDTDLDTMGRTLFGEARGEPEEGRVAVAWVIRNRASRAAYVGTLAGKPGAVAHVCRAPWQFSCWNAGDPNRALITSLAEEDFAGDFDLAADVLGDIVADPTGGADWPPSWAASMTKVGQFGAGFWRKLAGIRGNVPRHPLRMTRHEPEKRPRFYWSE